MKRLTVAFVFVCAVLLNACGISTDTSPRDIPANQVPFDLLATSTTQANTTLPVATVHATIYVIGPQRLVSLSRSVASPLTLGSALASLVQGPTGQEQASGLRSAINPTTSVISAQITGSTALVNLSDSFTGIGLQDQILGLAQLVYTATELPNVDNVQISLNGRVADVPRGDGSSTSGLLARTDYAIVGPVNTQN